MTRQRSFVVMSGVAGSGKSTLGRTLSASLGLEFLDKDDFLEPLYDRTFPSDRSERSLLSREADEAFKSAVQGSYGAVVVSFWRRVEMGHEFGTPFEWLEEIPGSRVREVHCLCPPEEAVRRFVSRVRHPGHHDIRDATLDAVARFSQTAALGPLGIGPSPLVVDTSRPIDPQTLEDLVASIGSA